MKLFLPPKAWRFAEDHGLSISLDSRAEETSLCCIIFNTAKKNAQEVMMFTLLPENCYFSMLKIQI